MAYNQNSQTYPTLLAALETYTVDDLKNLLGLFYPLKKQVRKAEIISMIVEQYESDGLRLIWLRLDELQQAAVSEVVHSIEYYHDSERFTAKYGGEPQWSAESDSIKVSRYGRSFSVLNLFFINNMMPADIKERLWEFVPAPSRTALKTLDAPPELVQFSWRAFDYETRQSTVHKTDVPVSIRDTERDSLEDVVEVLRLVDAGRVKVSDRTRLPSRVATQEVAEMLSRGDFYAEAPVIENDNDTGIGPIKSFAWPVILQTGGLAEVSGKKLRLTVAGQRALNKPTADVLCSLWKKWLSNTLFDELRRIDAVKGQTGRGQRALTAPRRRREVIVQALGDCPSGTWVAIDDFRRYMRAMGYRLDVTRDPWSLYISDPNYGSLGHLGYDSVLESRYLLCFLFEYAATLGLIDVGYIPPQMADKDYSGIWGTDDLEFFSRYDGLLFFRLNALGAYCLGRTQAFRETSPAPVPGFLVDAGTGTGTQHG